MLEIEDQEELEFEIYNKKMDEGLLSLQMVDFIIALVNVSDEQIKSHFMRNYRNLSQNANNISDGFDNSYSNRDNLNSNDRDLYRQVCSNITSLVSEQVNQEAKKRIENFTIKFQNLE